ncbi:PepSY domain-containing protein [Sulfuricurvum sp.]|uniref:PepSY domain-containing protein n=1 Tax=Sulfuricurvum sp. TaxID=2025608 RepID=UPI003BB6AC91
MKVFLIFLTCFSFSLYAAMGSSVSVPVQKHLKYTFGNHKNHPVQKLEEDRYLHSLVSMNEEEIKYKLSAQGYVVTGIEIRNIVREVVYQVYATDIAAKKIRLFVDPSNGLILKMEPIQ